MPHAPNGPVLPMHFREDGTELQLFTTIATLGTPQDITVQELRIESFFPGGPLNVLCFLMCGADWRRMMTVGLQARRSPLHWQLRRRVKSRACAWN